MPKGDLNQKLDFVMQVLISICNHMRPSTIKD